MDNDVGAETLAERDLINWDAAPFLKKVTEVAPGIIYIFNQHTQSNEYSNRSLGATLGYSIEEVRQMGAAMFPMLCHPDDLPVIGTHFERLKTLGNEEIARTEYRMRHKNGDYVWLLSHDTVFDRAMDGSVLRHIGLASDITKQKHAEEKAIEEKLRATTTNDELRAFSYSMSHDMKSPSNTLNLLLTELIESHGSTLDPDAANLVDMALATVTRMGQLIDDVLNYTRVIDRDLEVGKVVLNTLIAEILADLRAHTHSNRHEITVENLPDIQADQMQMRILFQNLIENALKFHAADKPAQVRISAAEGPDLKKCRITVEDNGIGIHPTKHEQIFTIFKRLNSNMDFSGSGLGLAVCRRIAANHGATITLASEPGQGAAFSVNLDLA